MRRAPKLLPWLIGVMILFNLLGFAIAVAAELPSEFDCACDPDEVLRDSVTRGSLLAAPLTVLVVLAIAALLIWTSGRWLGALGALAALALGVASVVGLFGEPLHPELSDPPFAFLVAWRVVAVSLSAALLALSATTLYGRLARYEASRTKP